MILKIVLSAICLVLVAVIIVLVQKLRAKTDDYIALYGRYDELYDDYKREMTKSNKKTIEIEYLPITKEWKEVNMLVRVPNSELERAGYIVAGGEMVTMDKIIKHRIAQELLREIESQIEYKYCDDVIFNEKTYKVQMNYIFWGDE